MAHARRAELVVPVTVEFEDVDAYRIVHHTKLVAYLERARLRWLASWGLSVFPEESIPVLAGLTMHFRRPAHLQDQLDVSVFVREFDAYRIVLGYRICRQGDLLARATTTISCADLGTGALAPLPESFQLALKADAEGRAR